MSNISYSIFVLLLTCISNTVQAETNETHFWLYTKHNLNTYEEMLFDGSEISLQQDTLFDSRKPTKLVAHGWGGGLHIDKIFAAAYAEGGLDYNVIGIDWREMEGSAKKQVVAVGVHAAHFIEVLIRDYGLLLEDVHAIGFSYGAHVVGNIGKEMNRGELGKIPRITVLDPGQIGFWNHPESMVTTDDADYVDVIHTSGGDHGEGGYGYLPPIGHADFYPNGGSSQPCTCGKNNCPGEDCSDWRNGGDHKRSCAYFEESILSAEKFPAWRCEISWEEFQKNQSCPFDVDSGLAPMGEWSNVEGPPQGIFFLTTHGDSPYSCEEDDCFLPSY